MARSCKAGCAAFRKLLRRYPGYSLVPAGRGGHMNLLAPSGEAVRLPDGRRLTVTSSPRNQQDAARELTRLLSSQGITS